VRRKRWQCDCSESAHRLPRLMKSWTEEEPALT